MKFITLIICVVFIGCAGKDSEKTEKIRVAGEGKIRIKPNQVMFTVKVAFTQPRMADAVRMTQQTIDSVVAILETYSQTESDIKTSNISANKDYNYNARTPVFIGFHAEQSLEFILSDIRKFTELTGKLLGTKINSISQVTFGHSKADSLFREADLLAYDDALKSAKKLCNRANVGLGKLTYLSNAQGYNNSSDGVVVEEMSTFSKGYGGNGFKVAPEVLEFKRSVISEYEID